MKTVKNSQAELRLQKRQRLHDDLAEYARQMSGTGADFDEDLEAATIELISSEDSD